MIHEPEFPEDPEEGEDVRHISLTTTVEVHLGHGGGNNELIYRSIDSYVVIDPGDALWDGVERSFTELN